MLAGLLVGALILLVVTSLLWHALSSRPSSDLGSVVSPPGRPDCRPAGGALPRPGPCGDTWRRAEAPNAAGAVVAPPSASVGAIWRALWATGSPLANNTPRRDGRTYAEYVWDKGRQTGVDPAVVMGFFRMESHYGIEGIAVHTHSLSNARPIGAQRALCTNDGCYADESTWWAGINDIYALLRAYADRGLTTADTAIPVWAPSSDHNNIRAYRAAVGQTLRTLNAASRATAP